MSERVEERARARTRFFVEKDPLKLWNKVSPCAAAASFSGGLIPERSQTARTLRFEGRGRVVSRFVSLNAGTVGFESATNRPRC